MRLKKDTIGSMLQGVSQQPPSRRKDGQNSLQLNMISDATSGLRRRAGLKFMDVIKIQGNVETDCVYGCYQSTKDGYKHLIVDTKSGKYVFDTFYDATTLDEPVPMAKDHPYLSGVKASDIQSTSMSGITYIVNTAKKVQIKSGNEGRLNPNHTGFAYIVAGAYSTTYKVEIKVGDKEYAWEHTTKKGDELGSADETKPVALAKKMYDAIVKWKTDNKVSIDVYIRGTYVSVKYTGTEDIPPLDMKTETSSAYIVTSGQCNLLNEALLPPRLPKEMDGQLCSVGSSLVATIWYQYSEAKGAWIECGAWDSPIDTNENTPLMITDDGEFEHMTIEGRNAGNDENNEVPQFLDTGEITGIGTYSGRLVFLSGAYVSMSAAGKPKRFFRSTVTTNLGSDRVDLASGSAQSTTYRQALQYNKDLIVIGDDVQAVIPFSTTKTSDNIALVVTSTMSCNSKVRPAQTLKTLLYPTRADTGYANILELTPSTVASSLYSTDEATSHIPRYIQGDVRFIAGDPNWGLTIIGTNGDRKSLIVHEYLFQGDEKAQNAWHKWTFDQEILWAYCGNDYIYLLFKGYHDGEIFMYSLDPAKESTSMSVHLDYSQVVNCVNDNSYVGYALMPYAKSGRIVCLYNEGRLKGCPVSINFTHPEHLTFELARITGEPYTGTLLIGIPFDSMVQPTIPVTRNNNDFAMLSTREKLLRLELTAYNSGEIEADVEDPATATSFSMKLPAVRVQSSDLELDKPLVAESPKFTIPCRTKPQSTQVTMRTNGVYDMHFISCDYIVKKER